MIKTFSIEELCEVITDGAHYSPRFFQGGIPMYSVKDMTDYGFDRSNAKTISLEDYLKLKNAGCEPMDDDILIAKDGSVMKHVFKYKHDEKCVLLSSIAILRPNKDIIDPDYLVFSILNSKIKKNIINNYVSGSGVPRIVLKDFKKIKIEVAKLELQSKISSFLNQINQKIKLNKKINQTLEDLIRIFYKSWFVDFDPVKSKIEGRSTKLSKEINDLFPNTFEDSVLGKIPKGWKIEKLDSIAIKINEKFKKGESWEQEKLIDLARMPLKSIGLNSYGLGNELSTSVSKFKKNDFLFGSIRPYFYKAGICPFDGVTNTSVFILRSMEDFDREFLYSYSSSNSVFKKSVQYSEGTKMPIISWKQFKKFDLVLPDKNIRKLFSSITRPLFDKIIQNIYEEHNLIELRDVLIPKLLSGEIKIFDKVNN